MIPILYYPEETAFTSQGIGALADCLRCEVTEEVNGPYTLELDYPITGKWYSEIQEGRIVTAWHDDKHDAQPFEIYARTAPISGIVTFYGRHISYRLNNVIVGAFEASGIVAAMAALKSNALTNCPFTFWTDRTTAGAFKVRVPSSLRALLGGTQGSILDTYGHGEYLFDKWAVRFYASRGTDSGVTIEYAKNLTDLTQEKSREGMYTAVAPFWASSDGDEVVTLPGLIVAPETETKTVVWTTQTGEEVTDQDSAPINVKYAIIQAMPMDLSGDFEEAPTEDQLRDLAQRRLNASTAWKPKDGLKVSFVQLWQTEQYKDIAPLERVALCDVVTVRHRALGVSAKMKVTKVVYDALRERYASMELGTASASLAQTINTTTQMALEKRPTRSMMAQAIDEATAMITGGLGGYVVIGTDPDGQPDEILIMDAPTIAEAVNVWRFNQGGLGHSHSGYNGPYNDVALTMDGKINANMITTGELTANLLKAGVIQSHDGENQWDLDNDQIILRRVRLDIQTNDDSYDVIDIKGRAGTWRNQITPLQYMLTSKTTGMTLLLQSGAIFGYTASQLETGVTLEDHRALVLSSDGELYLGGNGNKGYISVKNTDGTSRARIFGDGAIELVDADDVIRVKIKSDGSLTIYNASGTATASVDTDGDIVANSIDIGRDGYGIMINGSGYQGNWGFAAVKDINNNTVYVPCHK